MIGLFLTFVSFSGILSLILIRSNNKIEKMEEA